MAIVSGNGGLRASDRVSIGEPHNNGFVVGNDEIQAIQVGKHLDGSRSIPAGSPINT